MADTYLYPKLISTKMAATNNQNLSDRESTTFNHCPAKQIDLSHSLWFFNQLSCVTSFNTVDSKAAWEIV